MNKLAFYLCSAVCLLASSANSAAQNQTKNFKLNVKNPLNMARTDEPVVLQLSKMPTTFKVKSATVLVNNQEVPSQLDDLDGNGVFDELAFVMDMKAKENSNIDIILSSAKTKKNYTPRVYVDMQMSDKNKKYPEIQILSFPGNVPPSITYGSVYHHGPEFESELTGYRLYFDNRQSIDIYGKVERRLELAETRFYTTKEQKNANYGTDVLWAGKSVSLGSFRGWDGKNLLYVDSVELRTEAVRAYGPVRTIVDIIDKNWYYKGKELNMSQRYIQYAGHRDVEVQIHFDEELDDDVFSTGVMKLPTNNEGFLKDGLAASWGTNQPEPKDPTLETVGLGVSVPAKYIKSRIEDDANYLFVLANKTGHNLSYNLTFCAEKEKEGFKSSKAWFDYLKKWNTLLNAPCTISFKK
ncbi:MAG: DUF4861 domain-containing protein [Bacteroidaceae bacterium]|nr:DUF4861 domain-containing protein [Bacteroidaceae bacterium]